MGSIVPDKYVAKVEFYEAHNTPWSTNAIAIGTTAAAVTALNDKTVAARAAYQNQQALRNQLKAATLDFHAAVADMAKDGSDIIKAIKAKAAVTGDSVYSLAEIPAPATPTPVPAPGKPSDFVAQITESGSVVLKWKCVNPPNANAPVYEVARQIGTGGDFVAIGISGTKSFEDTTLPAGAGAGTVSYRVIAVRSTARGPEAFYTVRFGNSGGAGAGAGAGAGETVVAPKLAA